MLNIFSCVFDNLSSLKKCLFKSSARFWIGLFVFLELSCVSCLYILEINPLSVVLFAIIFSHFEGCLLILFIVCRIFYDGHSDWCEVISHCSFNLYFSNNEHIWAFHVFIGHPYVFYGKCLSRSSAQCLIALFVFLILSCMSCLYILEINLSVALFAVIFSHSEGWADYFLDGSHC